MKTYEEMAKQALAKKAKKKQEDDSEQTTLDI